MLHGPDLVIFSYAIHSLVNILVSQLGFDGVPINLTVLPVN